MSYLGLGLGTRVKWSVPTSMLSTAKLKIAQIDLVGLGTTCESALNSLKVSFYVAYHVNK
jgi:hypothetical protein